MLKMYLPRQASFPVAFLSLASTVMAQATSTIAATASITLIDFAALPTCAEQCGMLFDAQGSCTPPGVPPSNLLSYEECFCAFPEVQVFYTPGDTICPNACTDSNSVAELSTIRSWFTNYCAAVSVSATATGAVTGTASSSQSTGGTTADSNGSSSKSAGQQWLSSHARWVIMAVILIVGIIGVWLGAWLLRRHIIRKREKGNQQGIAWGPHQLQGMTGGVGYTDGVVDSTNLSNAARDSRIRVNPVAKQVYSGNGGDGLGFDAGNEKSLRKEKKRWLVNERT